MEGRDCLKAKELKDKKTTDSLKSPPKKRMRNDESAVELITTATVILLPPDLNELLS